MTTNNKLGKPHSSYPNIILITGFKGSGKSTIASHLVQSHGYTELAFAMHIYNGLAAMSGHPTDWLLKNKTARLAAFGNKTVRELLQTLGTEWGREMVDQDLWVKLVCECISPLRGACRYVISDCRFPNEHHGMLDYGHLNSLTVRLIGVTRPGLRRDEHSDHASERAMRKLMPMATFSNHSTREHLFKQVDEWLPVN